MISEVYNDFANGLLHRGYREGNLTQESFRAQFFSTLYDRIGHFGDVKTLRFFLCFLFIILFMILNYFFKTNNR